MLIKTIILEGFKRIGLAGISRLEWRPEAAYQIILGTNGSGKSSLMGELSPLPPATGDFVKGGRKYIELTHERSSYVLESTIGSAVKHSFRKDGEELNVGGTGAIQLDLVRQYFHYTKERHALLTGKPGVRFSQMNQADRRKWITELSSADYHYAFDLYDRLRTGLRDQEGALKHIKRRFNDETVHLQQLSEGEDIEGRVRALQDDLTKYLLARHPAAYTPFEANQILHGASEALQSTGKEIVNLSGRIPLSSEPMAVEALLERLKHYEEDEVRARTLVDRLQKEYSETESLRDELRRSEVDDVDEAKARVIGLADDKERLLKQIVVFPELLQDVDPQGVKRASDGILPDLVALYQQMPDNHDRHFTAENMQKTLERKRSILAKLDGTEHAIRQIAQRLHQIDHADPMTCPQCQYHWTPGVGVEERQALIDQKEAHEAYHKRGEDVLSRVVKYLEEGEAYRDLFRRWMGYVNQYPRLRPLWDHLTGNHYDLDHPSEHLDVFYTWQQETDAAARYAASSQELERLVKLLASANQGGVTQLEGRLVTIEKALSESTRQWQSARSEAKKLSATLSDYQMLNTLADRWDRSMEALDASVQDALDALGQAILEKEIVRTQTTLGSLQHTANERLVVQGVLDDLGKQIESVSLDHDALSLLVRALSPKEGFIAEQIRGFIDCFVAQLNSIISSVWSYDLEILPCDATNGNLDYRFPVRCGIDGPTIADVSEGSTSQSDIVDFAFRQTAMLYLGLTSYPLYIDELGASFDEAHRPAINQFVSRLMDSDRYSQVFMISHYAAGYTAFHDAEYLVLDTRNIAVPEPHNTHATLS